MPRITVAIPSYNHEKYIAQAIQSVLDQTCQDFEIIITDDGSSDRTVDVVKGFTNHRIKLFCFTENRGASAAANNCIRHACGEYVAILSSDDIFFPDKLEKQLNFLDEHEDIAAVFSYAKIIDEDGYDIVSADNFYKKIFIQPNRTRFEWLNYFFYHSNALCHPSVLIRRECYERVGYYNECLAQLPDFDFWIRLCMEYEIYVLQEDLVKFRIRDFWKNASAHTMEKRIRLMTENNITLRNFLDIKIRGAFPEIFPEIKKYWKNFHETLVPFYISQIILKEKLETHYAFAIFLLYNFLIEQGGLNFSDINNFSAIDYIRLTGEYNIFNIDK
jgi:glycosyltransferase involved in cell wall biosynthesis